MGVDFYNCKKCNEVFADCGDYVYCPKCYENWCCDECAEKDGLILISDEDGDYIEDECSCNFCRQEDFDDETLLEYLFKKYNVTRKEVALEYKKEKEKSNE